MTRTFTEGLGHLFTDWPIYAMVAAGVLARSPLLADDGAAKPERSQEEPAAVR